MDETRIITVGISRLLADLLETAMDDHADMKLVATIAEEELAAATVKRHRADVVIFNLAAERFKEICSPLLRAFPDLVAISITDRDRTLLRCELRPQVLEDGEASTDNLIEMIRRWVRRRHA